MKFFFLIINETNISARHITLIITELQWHGSEIPSIRIYGGETTESPLMKTINKEKVPPPIVSDGSAITIQLTGQMDFFATYSIFDSRKYYNGTDNC